MEQKIWKWFSLILIVVGVLGVIISSASSQSIYPEYIMNIGDGVDIGCNGGEVFLSGQTQAGLHIDCDPLATPSPLPTSTATSAPPTLTPVPTNTSVPQMIVNECAAFGWSKLEAQGWWQPDAGHVHLTACVPLFQSVSGSFTIPVRVVLHDNPGTVNFMRLSSSELGTIYQDNTVSFSCPVGTCSFYYEYLADAGDFQAGWDGIRMSLNIPSEGNIDRWFASTDYPIWVGSGPPPHPCSIPGSQLDLFQGKGWYEYSDSGQNEYATARLHPCDMPPNDTIEGAHQFSTRAGSNGLNARLFAAVNRSHGVPAAPPFWLEEPALSPGPIILDITTGLTSYSGFTIDGGTASIAPGWNTVAVHIDHAGCNWPGCTQTEQDSSLTGVLKYWFDYQPGPTAISVTGFSSD